VKKRSGKAYELIEAKDVMGKMVRFQKTMENVWPDQEFIDLDGEQYNMDAWLKLLGMFISDGYSHNNIIYITAIKERKQEFVKSILENLHITYAYHNDGNYFISGVKNQEVYKKYAYVIKDDLINVYNKSLEIKKQQSLLENYSDIKIN
jgi:hypothetical protein